MIDVGFCNVLADGRIEFRVPCWCCGYDYTFVVPEVGFQAWQDGAFVQECFPSMPAEWREMLISATCPACFAEMYPPDEEVDDD